MDREGLVRPIVIYHGGCPDGFCAAWVARKVHPDAEFVASHHGDPPPDVGGRSVFILDFSFKRPVMEGLIDRASQLLLLDHHKTAFEELGGFQECQFEMGKSGARIAWDYFIGASDPHWLVKYTEDRDLWNWALPQSREVNAAIASYPKTFGAWDRLAERDLSEVITDGDAILRYKNQLIEHYVAGAVEMEMDGYNVLASNCGARNLVSEVAGELAKGRPFGLCWYVYKNRKIWSLRSDEEGMDVSEIAKKHGGGGHPRAAGFQEDIE